MNRKRLIWTLMLVLAASLVLSSCSGAPLSNNWNGLSADAERAYISSGSFIYAVDLQSGKQVWKFPAEADAKLTFYAAPVLVSEERLLVGSAGATHSFFSLDPKTGKENWAEPFSKAKGAWMSPPLVVDDTIYAPNADGFLYLLDLNGKESATALELGGALWASPVTDSSYLYISSLDHYVHIVNLADMSYESVKLGGAAPGSPAVGMGGAYVGSFDETVKFISSNGAVKDTAEAEGWIWTSPVVYEDALYYADLKGNIVSLGLESGKQNWVVPQKDDAVVAGLLLNDGRLYAATESGNLLALDLDGKIIWQKLPGGKLYTTPVVTGDLLLVAPYQADYALVAYDLDGKQVWTFTPEK